MTRTKVREMAEELEENFNKLKMVEFTKTSGVSFTTTRASTLAFMK